MENFQGMPLKMAQARLEIHEESSAGLTPSSLLDPCNGQERLGGRSWHWKLEDIRPVDI